MTSITVRANQDIYDVCIQEYGTLEFVSKLIQDNELNMTGDISQGQVLIIDKVANGNEDVKDFFELGKKHSQNGYIFKNDIPPLNFDNNQIKFDSIVQTWDLIRI